MFSLERVVSFSSLYTVTPLYSMCPGLAMSSAEPRLSSSVMSSVGWASMTNSIFPSGRSFTSCGMGISIPPRGGIVMVLPSAFTPVLVIGGMFCCSSVSVDGVLNLSMLEAMGDVFASYSVTMSICLASSSALSLKISEFPFPVLRDSIRSERSFDVTPITLALITLVPRLFSADTKSVSLPPFQLNETVLSPTTKV